MKFFKGRLVHNIYLLVSCFLCIVGYLIYKFSHNQNLVEGVGKVIIVSMEIMIPLLVILYLLPRKVFYLWKYISIPFIAYVFIGAFFIPTYGNCTVLGCNERGWFVFGYAVIFSLITLLSSIIISVFQYFLEKKKIK